MAKAAIEQIPEHLREHISEQRYELYTDIDHASWRYIMRISKAFFKDHAHKKYLDGLEQTGITTERIPRISEMDEKLKKIGWRAVTVTGFIPPAAFLEFQSLSVLPIACDMRRLEHLEYTPSPDIVHEAAGHAPIIADPAYAKYLHKFGEIARKAIFAKEDLQIYEAIKYLSDIKEDPRTSPAEVEQAYKALTEAYKKVRFVSESSKLSRLGWWSIEYGLIREKNEFKIYGAGLLSSVGESYSAIHDSVKKVPLTLSCVDTDFDITKPQPQLFYVDQFSQLENVIDELAATMAFKMGGLAALKEALRAETVNTVQLDSELQIGGVLSAIYLPQGSSGEGQSQPFYLQFSGPSQLAFAEKELAEHSSQYHSHGFGTPLGKIKNLNKSAEHLTTQDLDKLGFRDGQKGVLEFESGVVVTGVLKSTVTKSGQGSSLLIISFTDCTVKMKSADYVVINSDGLANETKSGEKIFFDPAWGVFDMACGVAVTSVYGGAPDRAGYLKSLGRGHVSAKAQTSNMTKEHEELLPLYESVRRWRESDAVNKPQELLSLLGSVVEKLDKKYSADWLLRLEILELLAAKNLVGEPSAKGLKNKITQDLNQLASKSKVISTLVSRGLELL